MGPRERHARTRAKTHTIPIILGSFFGFMLICGIAFAVGMVGSFLAALLAVKVFIRLMGRLTLVPFAIYRLVHRAATSAHAACHQTVFGAQRSAPGLSCP